MIIEIKKKGDGKKIEVKKLSYFGKGIGLMFRTSKTRNLLFEFNDDRNRAIHSYFVFFDFLAIWLDEQNNILEYRLVRPFTTVIKPLKSFRKLVEVPLNDDNMELVRFVVGRKV